MYEIEVRDAVEQPVAVVHGTVDRDTIGSWLAGTYGVLAMHLQRIGVPITGMPFARYHRRNDGGIDVVAGLPVASIVDRKDEVVPDTLPGGEMATTWHRGPYEEIGPAYEAIEAWLEQRGAEAVGDAWEIYHTDPEEEPDASTWLTEVVQPYRSG